MKTCTKCGETKALSEFSKDKQRSDGLQSSCRDCNNAKSKAWYAANREHRNASKKARYANNPDSAKAMASAWYSANSERAKSTAAAWRADNPEKIRTYNRNRRARKREVGGRLSPGLASKLFKLQRGKCACCGQPLGNDYHLDHIIPMALCGTNTDDNMQLLRGSCNLKKGAKHPVEFMQQRGFLL